MAEQTKEPAVKLPTTKPMIGGAVEEMEVPTGSIAINEVKPGFKPGEGSPNPSEPDKLFNPNNPLSPTTRPANPSNPANQANTQSDRSGDERRQYEAVMAKEKQPTAEQTKKAEELKKKKEELTKKISEALAKFDNRESQVPPNHEYWSLVTELRTLSNP